MHVLSLKYSDVFRNGVNEAGELLAGLPEDKASSPGDGASGAELEAYR